MVMGEAAARELTIRNVLDQRFWEGLCPSMTIGQARPWAPRPAPAHIEDTMRRHGYALDVGVVPPAAIGPMRTAVETIVAHGQLGVWAFVYDAFWELWGSLGAHAAGCVGRQPIASEDGIWTFCLADKDWSAGTAPHRDTTQRMYSRYGLPGAVTVWVPLTDATPENGCMYLLPADRDRWLRKQKKWLFRKTLRLKIDEMQNVLAVPVPAGGFLAWDQNLLHWGGRATDRAAGPRISIAYEFVAHDVTADFGAWAHKDALAPVDRGLSLSFEERLVRVAMSILLHGASRGKERIRNGATDRDVQLAEAMLKVLP